MVAVCAMTMRAVAKETLCYLEIRKTYLNLTPVLKCVFLCLAQNNYGIIKSVGRRRFGHVHVFNYGCIFETLKHFVVAIH